MPANALAGDARKMYIRPLIISLFFAIVGELLLLVIYGIILFPEGNLFYKVFWTLGIKSNLYNRAAVLSDNGGRL